VAVLTGTSLHFKAKFDTVRQLNGLHPDTQENIWFEVCYYHNVPEATKNELDPLLVILIARDFCILLTCFGHELCEILLFRLRDSFWLKGNLSRESEYRLRIVENCTAPSSLQLSFHLDPQSCQESIRLHVLNDQQQRTTNSLSQICNRER
jgi:hypothetical protein